jgi:large subunit ribosomal protein L21
MYAVIETGGKQYRVELGTELAVERLDATPGTTINLDRVLLVADGDDAQIGTPTVADALVTADVLRQDRGEKIIVFKYRPKARHRAKKGHRQEQTVLRVADIRFNGRSAADEAGSQKTDKQAERDAAKAAAEQKAAADAALAAKLAADTEAKTAADADDKPAAKSTARKTAAKADTATEAETTDEQPAAKAASKAPAKAKPAAKPAAEKTTAQDKPKTTRSSAKKDE